NTSSTVTVPSLILLHLVLFCVNSWVNFVASFFFSSRRRHTRFSRDWSSDVCSSDLTCRFLSPGTSPASTRPSSTTPSVAKPPARSEERRVGKECGCRSLSYRQRKLSYCVMIQYLIELRSGVTKLGKL